MSLHGSRWIVLFKLGAATFEPRFQTVTHFRGEVNEAQTQLAAGVFPSHLSDAFDLVRGPGQRKLDGDRAQVFRTMGQLDGHAPFSQVGGHGAQLSGSVVDLNGDRSFDGDSGIAAAFPFHQGAHGAKTGLGAFRRKRLVKNEMGSQIESASQAGLAADDGYSDGALVAGSGACAAQYARGGGLVCTVHNDCFKPPAGQFLNGGFGIGALLHADFQLTQHPPQHAHDFLVCTENERL